MISVIIPVFNCEKYLEQCVATVLRQSFTDFELFLVDDGSSDASGVMCDALSKKDARIHVIHKRNGGASSARNAALDVCKGDFVVFVDSDDYVDESYLATLHKGITNYSDCELAFSGMICVRNENKVSVLPNRQGVVSARDAFEDILYESGVVPGPWAKIYRRSLFETLRFREGMMFEDEYLFASLLNRINKVAYIREAHYYYIQRLSSVTYSKFSDKKIRDQLIADEYMCDSALRLDVKLLKAAQRRRARNCMSLLRLAPYNMAKSEQVCRLRAIALENGISVLLNGKASGRDKVGILTLSLGFRVFLFFWHVYDFVRNLNLKRRVCR